MSYFLFEPVGVLGKYNSPAAPSRETCLMLLYNRVVKEIKVLRTFCYLSGTYNFILFVYV